MPLRTVAMESATMKREGGFQGWVWSGMIGWRRSFWYGSPSAPGLRDTDTLMRRMQSETLKYLYLLFSDDSVLPFDSECPLI